MIKLKQLLNEGRKEDLAVDFLKNLITGTEFENKVMVAGGAVRDELMGKPIKDIDVVVDIPEGGIKFANWATEKMGNYKEGSNPVLFPAYGTSKFTMKGITHGGEDLSDIDIEAVAPRAEEYEPGSRKPKVTGASLKADAERRDLTANSLFKNISTGEIVDLTGRGRDDLEKGIARTPLDPDKTFSDDPLRMMRLLRFFVKYNWQVPMEQLRALKRNASQIQNISMERVQEELIKILKTENAGKALKLMRQSGLAKYVFPEVDITADKLKMIQGKISPEVKLAVLFHNLNKKEVEVILKRLKFSNDQVSLISNMVVLENFFDQIEDFKRIRQFRRIAGRYAKSTLELIDVLNKPVNVAKIREKLEKIKNDPIKPPVGGNDLIAMGVKPSREFSIILNKIQDKFDEDPDVSKEELLAIAKSSL